VGKKRDDADPLTKEKKRGTESSREYMALHKNGENVRAMIPDGDKENDATLASIGRKKGRKKGKGA